jgi:hypothetical protein
MSLTVDFGNVVLGLLEKYTGVRQLKAKLHEHLGDDYEKAAGAVIQERLTKAGVRLAAVLNALWP